jgi:Mrp family chromosome partitioning ATPase
MAQDSDGLDLAQALAVLRRRAWLIALCTIAVAAAAFGFSKMQQKEYTATSALVFGESRVSQLLATMPSSSTGSQIAQQASNIELVGLGDAAEKTAARIGGGLTSRDVSKSVTVRGSGESEVVTISATSTSPVLAAKIANTYADAFVKGQAKANARFLDSAQALVKRQVDRLPPAQRYSSAAVELQNRAQTLQLLQDLDYNDVKIAQTAQVPTYATSPQTKKNTMVGVVLGLILGLGLAFAVERLRRGKTLATGEELAAVYGLPLLGVVGEGEDPEAFALVRAQLRFASGADDARLLLLTEAERGDGAAEVCRGLAEAAARLGTRALVLEANLRDPSLPAQIGLGAGPGLERALSGAVSVRDAIRSVPVIAPDSGARLGFDVLAPGTTPLPSPPQWIEGPAMAMALQQLRSEYDLVLLDAPPLTAFADAFPLLERVDGVVVVGRLGHSGREPAERLRATLEASGVRRLGAIARDGGRRGKAREHAAATAHVAPPAVSANGVGQARPAVGSLER